MFLDDLKYKFQYVDDKGVKWYSVEDILRYEYKCEAVYTVPKNTMTDMASVPSKLHWLYRPRSVRYIKSAVIHDFLYMQRKDLSRLKCDLIFFDAMKWESKQARKAMQLNKYEKPLFEFRDLIQRSLFFGAVRLFGWLYRK